MMQNKTFIKILTMNYSTDLDENRVGYHTSTNMREVFPFRIAFRKEGSHYSRVLKNDYEEADYEEF
jgi:hypothetical protein